MVFILAVSFLHIAFESLTTEKKYLKRTNLWHSRPEFKHEHKNFAEGCAKLFEKEVKDNTKAVTWQDVINFSISRLKSNVFRSFSIPELLELKQLENRLRALVYSQRDQTLYVVEELKKKQSIIVLHVEKDFVSS